MLYVVKFHKIKPKNSTKVVGSSTTWWPKGEGAECDGEAARRRALFLVTLAIKKTPIEGLFIDRIRVEDVRGRVMLALDPEEGGIFGGPWAKSFVAMVGFGKVVDYESPDDELAVGEQELLQHFSDCSPAILN